MRARPAWIVAAAWPLACAAAGPVASPAAPSIGVATQAPDGTILLQLRAEGPGGTIGDALLRYPPTDRDYAMVARHVGPIPKGGAVMVKPFDAR